MLVTNRVEEYTGIAEQIARRNEYGYSQLHRWAQYSFDCATLVIRSVSAAGIPVRLEGATFTGNMYEAFKRAGFSDVTDSVNLSTGEGLIRGDILLTPYKHTEIFCGDGRRVGAHCDENGGTAGHVQGDQTGREISISPYVNLPWKYVLRYTGIILPTQK